MSTSIGSATSTSYVPPTTAQPVAPVPTTDADGDHDGSKVAAVEPPKITTGTVGTIINTSA